MLPRRVDARNDYRCKVIVSTANTVRLDLVRRIGGTETALTSTTVSGLTQVANQAYAFACRVVPSGTGTQVTGKLWRVGRDRTVRLAGLGHGHHRCAAACRGRSA